MILVIWNFFHIHKKSDKYTTFQQNTKKKKKKTISLIFGGKNITVVFKILHLAVLITREDNFIINPTFILKLHNVCFAVE